MLTDKDLRLKYGKHIRYIYKVEEPFTELNHSPGGVLIGNNECDKVLCYECEEWYGTLSGHLRIKHKMTPVEYKEKYGFSKKTALCSEKMSRKLSASTSKRMGSEHFREECIKNLLEVNKGRKTPVHKGEKISDSMQHKNEFNICPEQLLDRISIVSKQCEKEFPGIEDFKREDKQIVGVIGSYGGIKEFYKKVLGKKIPNRGGMKKEEVELIADLRTYVRSFGKLPWKHRGVDDCFSHSTDNYVSHFNSLRQAYVRCGVRRVKRGKWEVYG